MQDAFIVIGWDGKPTGTGATFLLPQIYALRMQLQQQHYTQLIIATWGPKCILIHHDSSQAIHWV
jgi:hypothetical protein